jgi:hypothetical protein
MCTAELKICPSKGALLEHLAIGENATETQAPCSAPSRVVQTKQAGFALRTHSLANEICHGYIHILLGYWLSKKPVSVRNITLLDGASIVSVSMCVDGKSFLSNSKPHYKISAKHQIVILEPGYCVVYQSNVTYAVEQLSITYCRFYSNFPLAVFTIAGQRIAGLL